ncbi:disulfide oxidoreductase [Paenibacillus chitinolyticus]|uniref:disulfide oxidoreductase n=1 Tax=Paenibacillus chitinolyticus TaxID=79263 RepID=UPI00355602BB
MKSNSFLKNNALHMAWAISVVATLGSLYFSEIMDFTPCKLCWYQRILMYPLVLILGIAATRKDNKQVIYALPFSVWGMGISLYHYLMQKTSLFKEAASKCGIVACDQDYIDWLGFITIPLLAFTAFTLITVILGLLWVQMRKEK